jgi:hypothetical protein
MKFETLVLRFIALWLIKEIDRPFIGGIPYNDRNIPFKNLKEDIELYIKTFK